MLPNAVFNQNGGSFFFRKTFWRKMQLQNTPTRSFGATQRYHWFPDNFCMPFEASKFPIHTLGSEPLPALIPSRLKAKTIKRTKIPGNGPAAL